MLLATELSKITETMITRSDLSAEQSEAVSKLKNGSILCGGVGSGKSRTALCYYGEKTQGSVPLYIITTARKRDEHDWEKEGAPYGMDISNVDSWNNIKKYESVSGAFFIFDEQRVVGYGAWSKTFIKIARNNRWILLSATPGDKWMDYVPVFIANGFYRNKTEFIQEHVVWNHHTQYPSVDRYLNSGRLIRLRNEILVNINYRRKTVQHHIDICCSYDSIKYRQAMKLRRNLETGEPIETASEYCGYLLKIVNSSQDRQVRLLDILSEHSKVIVFYNFNYELDILKSIPYDRDVKIAEWNGHQHQPIPKSDRWVYLVQYTAGAEGWNCIETDTMVFYSQSYSYRATVQAAGRIDRRNTAFTDLYYYHFMSKSSIDASIKKSLKEKKEFNLAGFARFMKEGNDNE